MPKPRSFQNLLAAEDEYTTHDIEQKIKDITSQENISADEIKNAVDSLPNDTNIELLKNSIHLLHKNNCLTTQNLGLIASKENFEVSSFTNGILKDLDNAGLLNSDNMEWLLKRNDFNALRWNIAVLHKNGRLTHENLHAIKNGEVNSRELSTCFDRILTPRNIPSHFKVPTNFLSTCSHSFFNLGINPLTLHLPPGVSEYTDSLISSCTTQDLNNNLVLANLIALLLEKCLQTNKNGKSTHTRTHDHIRLSRELDNIEKTLNQALDQYSEKDPITNTPKRGLLGKLDKIKDLTSTLTQAFSRCSKQEEDETQVRLTP